MFLIYPFMALLSVFFTLLTWILAPILAVLVKSDGNLPKYLYWFQTFDNPVTAGENEPFNWLMSPYSYTPYWAKVMWLWRNPAYGFDMFLLGASFTPGEWTVVVDQPNRFFAYSKWGAFSYRGTYFKWGWKAWARLSGEPNWTQYNKVPICVVR